MAQESSQYADLGVSAGKEEVHAATRHLDEGLFPGAFCRIFPDLRGDPDYCTVVHADGIGTKLALAYLAWKQASQEVADLAGADFYEARQEVSLKIWKRIAQCGLVMNLDDMCCVGAVKGPFLISGLLDRNACKTNSDIDESKVIPGSVIAGMIDGAKDFCDLLTSSGIPCIMAGGETADVGDLVRTITGGYFAVCSMKRSEIIDPGRIVPGDVIIGFSSTGQAKWENEPNSGIGCNGLTGARHGALHHDYLEYAETYASETPLDLVYHGKYRLKDLLPGDNRFTIGSALLSPTRTYLPLIKAILGMFRPEEIHALIHCTGGGQTKIKKFGGPGLLYVKEQLFPIPPVFQMIQDSSGMSWKEMHEVFNVGHRLEAVVPAEIAHSLILLSELLDINAKIIGAVDVNGEPTVNAVKIISPYGTFDY